ncbi:MAG: TMEM165/GDT1 family protein [Pseudomonadales bacterium]
MIEALLVSTGVVALAEIGDKTQLLAFVLAAHYRRPLPIVAGIVLATLLNHALAGLVGAWIAALMSPEALRWVLGASFLGMAMWTLVPDRLDESDQRRGAGWGAFGATLIAFFLAEMGDKTQVATVAMVAHFAMPVVVVIGTTLGMLIANVPAVFLGERLAGRVSMRLVHGVAAAMFALLGMATLLGVGSSWLS